MATNNVGWQCYLNGDAECAEKYFQRAVDMGGYANSHRGMAILYARKGMFKEAIASMRKAIELGPTQTELIADLAQVQALGGDRVGALTTLELAKASPRFSPRPRSRPRFSRRSSCASAPSMPRGRPATTR